MSSPRDRPSSTYPNPSARVNASSCAAVLPGLADVVPGHRQRLVGRDLPGAELHQVADQAQVRLRREEPFLLRDVLLEDVRLQGPVQRGQVGALPLGGGQVHAEDRDRRAADRHRRGHVGQRDPGEQRVHVRRGVDRHPAVADLAERARVVGVPAHQGGHVEGHGQPGAARAQQHLVPLVGLPGVAEPGELADRPGPAAVPGRVQAAGERVLPRPADPVEARHDGPLRRPVHRLHVEAGQGGEVGRPDPGAGEPALPPLPPRLQRPGRSGDPASSRPSLATPAPDPPRRTPAEATLRACPCRSLLQTSWLPGKNTRTSYYLSSHVPPRNAPPGPRGRPPGARPGARPSGLRAS